MMESSNLNTHSNLTNDTIDYIYAKNAAGVLVEESFFVNRMNIFERKNNLFRIDKQQFPMDEV